MSIATMPAQPPVSPPEETRLTYLNVAYGLKSWLLTKDHKRIGILYLLTITLMFFIGGIAITIVRLSLLEPDGRLIEADTYNKMFTCTVSSWSSFSWCRRSRRPWEISFSR